MEIPISNCRLYQRLDRSDGGNTCSCKLYKNNNYLLLLFIDGNVECSNEWQRGYVMCKLLHEPWAHQQKMNRSLCLECLNIIFNSVQLCNLFNCWFVNEGGIQCLIYLQQNNHLNQCTKLITNITIRINNNL